MADDFYIPPKNKPKDDFYIPPATKKQNGKAKKGGYPVSTDMSLPELPTGFSNVGVQDYDIQISKNINNGMLNALNYFKGNVDKASKYIAEHGIDGLDITEKQAREYLELIKPKPIKTKLQEPPLLQPTGLSRGYSAEFASPAKKVQQFIDIAAEKTAKDVSIPFQLAQKTPLLELITGVKIPKGKEPIDLVQLRNYIETGKLEAPRQYNLNPFAQMGAGMVGAAPGVLGATKYIGGLPGVKGLGNVPKMGAIGTGYGLMEQLAKQPGWSLKKPIIEGLKTGAGFAVMEKGFGLLPIKKVKATEKTLIDNFKPPATKQEIDAAFSKGTEEAMAGIKKAGEEIVPGTPPLIEQQPHYLPYDAKKITAETVNDLTEATKTIQQNFKDKPPTKWEWELSKDERGNKRISFVVSQRIKSGELPLDVVPGLRNIKQRFNLDDNATAYLAEWMFSTSGKSLNRLSQWGRAIDDATAGIEGLADIPKTSKDGLKNFFDTWRASLVSLPETAARNYFSSGILRFGVLDTIDEAVTGVLDLSLGNALRASKLVRKQPATPYVGFKEALLPAYENVRSFMLQLNPARNEAINAILVKHPDIEANLMGTPVMEVMTGGISGKANKVLMGFNNWQEFGVRRMVMEAEVRKGLIKAGLNPENFYTNPQLIPKYIVKNAVDKSIKITYAEPAKLQFFKSMVLFQKQNPWATVLYPFPRFMDNALRTSYEFSPFSLVKLMTRQGREALSSGNPTAILNTASQGIIGSTMLWGAYQLRESDKAGEKWHELKTGNKYFDTRPVGAPFNAFMFLGDLGVKYNRLKSENPRMTDEEIKARLYSNLSTKEIMEGAMGIRLAGTTLRLFNIFGEAKPENVKDAVFSFARDFFGGLTRPAQILQKPMSVADENEQIIRDTKIALRTPELKKYPEKAIGEIAPSMMEDIYGVSQTLPGRPKITEEGYMRKATALYEGNKLFEAIQMTLGITGKEKAPIEKEIDRLGIKFYTLLPRTDENVHDMSKKTGIDENEIMNRVQEEMGKNIAKTIHPKFGLPIAEVVKTPWYQALPEDKKVEFVKSVFSDAKGMAKYRVIKRLKHQQTFPDYGSNQ